VAGQSAMDAQSARSAPVAQALMADLIDEAR